MTVLLHKANFLRRREHWTETLIVEDGDALKVVKRLPGGDGGAAPPDLPETLAERHARLSAAQSVVRLPALLSVAPGEVVVEHVAGETSLARVERCLAERRFAAAQQEIDTVLALLRALPAVDADPAAAEGFRAIFDPDGAAPAGTGSERCLLPGLYDFGLGNLVIPADPGSPRVLVDWEWTFPFPVPVAFVAWVAIRNTAEYLQPMIRALCGTELPGLVFFDDVVVPAGWAAAGQFDPASVARFLALEVSIQRWIHVTHRPLDRYRVHPEPLPASERRDENATLLVARLERELAAARDERDVLRQRLDDAEVDLINQRRVLDDLDGIKFASKHVLRLARRRMRTS